MTHVIMHVFPKTPAFVQLRHPLAGDAEELRQKLIKDYSTGTIMLSGLIRIAFSAVPTEKLGKLFENIYNCIMNLRR